MNNIDKGKKEWNKMIFVIFITIIMIAMGIVYSGGCGNSKNGNNDYDPSSVIDNPSKE